MTDIRERIRDDRIGDLAKQMVETEMEFIREKYGPRYHTRHEAFGVLYEELTETVEELEAVIIGFNDWFQEDVRRDFSGWEKLEAIKEHGYDCLREIVQVIAVTEKTLTGVEK